MSFGLLAELQLARHVIMIAIAVFFKTKFLGFKFFWQRLFKE